MAKRQSASLPNYGPNTALIEGAKLVYGTQNKPLKPTKIDMSGVDALRERANAYRQEQTAKINKEETRMANYLANMNYMDTGVVPENYLPQVQSALKEYKDEYFQVSQQLSQLKSSDPEYQNLNIRLLEINNGIKSIANTFTDQKKNKKDDLLMFDSKNNKKLSILNDAKVPGIVEGVGRILRNEAPMKIENGVVKYELNGEWVKYEDIPELQYRADDEAGKIGTILSTLSTTTPEQGLTSEQLADYRTQIGNMLNNQDVMLSLALDDFDGYDLGLNLSAYEIQQNPSAAKEQVLDKYMSMIEASAKKGQERNKKTDPNQSTYGLTGNQQAYLNTMKGEFDQIEGAGAIPGTPQPYILGGVRANWSLSKNSDGGVTAKTTNGDVKNFASWAEYEEEYTERNKRKLK